MARYVGRKAPPDPLPTTAAPYDSGVLMSETNDKVAGLVFSDTAGTLYFDQSVSGESGHWDYVQELAVAAGVGIGFSYELLTPYYRMRYVPATDPTVFRFSARQTSAGKR